MLTLYKAMTYALCDFQLHNIWQRPWEIGSTWAKRDLDRGRWGGSPEWCKQHGHDWACPWKALSWSLV